MNPDCEVRPGALPTMLEHLRNHPATAVVGPKILNPDGTLQYSARAFPDHLTFLFNRYLAADAAVPGQSVLAPVPAHRLGPRLGA